jgi:hypothetical protein
LRFSAGTSGDNGTCFRFVNLAVQARGPRSAGVARRRTTGRRPSVGRPRRSGARCRRSSAARFDRGRPAAPRPSWRPCPPDLRREITRRPSGSSAARSALIFLCGRRIAAGSRSVPSGRHGHGRGRARSPGDPPRGAAATSTGPTSTRLDRETARGWARVRRRRHISVRMGSTLKWAKAYSLYEGRLTRKTASLTRNQ